MPDRIGSQGFGIITFLIILAAAASSVAVMDNWNHRLIFVVVTTFGALGGLLYASRNRHIEMPHRDRSDEGLLVDTYSLGYWSDILGGIGGAYIIFLLLPFNVFDPTQNATPAVKTLDDAMKNFDHVRHLFRVIALSMLGGYTGRALMQKAQVDVLGLKEVKGEMQELKQRSVSITQFEHTRRKVTNLLYRLLDVDHPPSKDEIGQLPPLLAESNLDIRGEVFYKTKAKRQTLAIELIRILDAASSDPTLSCQQVLDTCQEGNRNECVRVENTMQAVSHVFNALQLAATQSPEHGESDLHHRYLAQLAYAQKDLLLARNDIGNHQEWRKIKTFLEKAIHLRDQNNETTGTDLDDNYGYYELNLAICHIFTDESFINNQPTAAKTRERIMTLLTKARTTLLQRGGHPSTIFPVNIWCRLNHISIDL